MLRLQNKEIRSCYGIIEMDIDDERLADHIVRSLAPDNKPLPEGMGIFMHKIGQAIRIEVIVKNCRIMRLISTIDEILALVKILLELGEKP